MLSNTLAIIEMTIHNKLNKGVNTTALLDYLKHYRINMWIYPGVLKRKFSLEISEIYAFLLELEREGILQSYYELYCGHCHKSMGIVKLLNDMPETFECELCHEELPSLENSILVYKVVRDD